MIPTLLDKQQDDRKQSWRMDITLLKMDTDQKPDNGPGWGGGLFRGWEILLNPSADDLKKTNVKLTLEQNTVFRSEDTNFRRLDQLEGSHSKPTGMRLKGCQSGSPCIKQR